MGAPGDDVAREVAAGPLSLDEATLTLDGVASSFGPAGVHAATTMNTR
jgi:hypothetical protein